MKAEQATETSNAKIIEIPAGRREKKPIIIESNGESNRLRIVAKEGSECTVIELQESNCKEQNNALEITVERNSRVKYFTVQNLSESTSQNAIRVAEVAACGEIEWSDFHFGGAVCKNHTTTRLLGEGASVANNAMFFGTERQHFDFQTNALHEAANTRSTIIAKGALDGNARAGYRGVIYIQPGKENCIGSQKEEFMLLSKNAKIEAVPELEIANNNVKCTHATSITHMNQDKLFYLSSRGLERKQAANLVISGFFTPLLEKTPKQIHELLQGKLEERIK